MSESATRSGPVQEQLQSALQAGLNPSHLQLENESHLHGGAPRDPNKIRESHFKAVIVSEAFAGKRMVQQHQLVYSVLGELMDAIHALGLHTYTPEQWAQRDGAPASPQCPKA